MKNKDIWQPKNGYVSIHIIDEDNNIKDTLIDEDKNLFVNTSIDIMTGCLIGDNNKKIDTLSIGDGGVIDSIIQTPTINDTALYNETYRKVGYDSVITETILEDKYIVFKFVIPKSEGNGALGVTTITEMGLFSNDGTMFSRKTFSEKIKSIDKSLLIEWKLAF